MERFASIGVYTDTLFGVGIQRWQAFTRWPKANRLRRYCVGKALSCMYIVYLAERIG
jgi:hypothetical protein